MGTIMKRWKLGLVSLTVAFSSLLGCKQMVYLHEVDRNIALGGIPENLDVDPTPTYVPGSWASPLPATVDTPERPPRYITLQEAIAIALEQGNIGSRSQLNPGLANDDLSNSAQFTQVSVVGTDSIKAFALDPAVVGANIDASLAKFDSRFRTSMTWNKTDNAISNILASFQNGDTFNFSSGVSKFLPSGGVANITWSTNYTRLVAPPVATVNPSWQPALGFQLEQPLLKGYGVEINQLRSQHPGSIQNPNFQSPGNGLTAVEGILITRVRFDQQRAEFEKAVNNQLLNVEAAYWNLYEAYGELYARDEAVVDALKLWKNLEERVKGQLTAPPDEAQARAQLETFRAQRIAAVGQVLLRDRTLRSLLGMDDDGTRLIPIDAPTLAPFEPDWESGKQETLTNHPALIQAREELKARQFDIMVKRDQLRPDLRALSQYNINGLGSHLNGPMTVGGVPNNALESLSSNRFNNWTLGLVLDVPIGFRTAHSELRVARLNLARTYYQLRDFERKAEVLLRNDYSNVNQQYRTIEAQRAAYEAAARQYSLTLDREEIIEPKSLWLQQLLAAQQSKVQAKIAEYQAIAAYNTALASWQFSKGTILQYNNVMISEGPLPQYAQLRAIDHQRERTAAIMVRQRPDGTNGLPAGYPLFRDPAAGMVPTVMDAPMSVPQMIRNAPQQKNTPIMPPADVPAAYYPPNGMPVVPPGSTIAPANSPYNPNQR
jgi:outer membrane protein TolC